jgi:hypothetical protein
MVADVWDELVTVGLLGTDRRDPPELPAGPLGDLVADTLRTAPEARLLAAVAATAVARRSGITPSPARPALMPPEPDCRPVLPAAAVARWRSIIADWPVLEAEWLAVAASSGWRPAPDLLVAVLRRHRRSRVLVDAVIAWGGGPAAWLVDHVPELAPTGVPPAPGAVRPLPVPAEIEALLHDGGARDSTAVVAVLSDGLLSGAYRWSHRAVLLNAIARIDRRSLPEVIAALRARHAEVDDAGDGAAPLALWEALIELAEVRRDMLDELQPSIGTTA